MLNCVVYVCMGVFVFVKSSKADYNAKVLLSDFGFIWLDVNVHKLTSVINSNILTLKRQR